VIADKTKKEIEKAKKSHRESVSIGTTHAREILDSRAFRYSTPAQQNHIMADCIAAQAACETAVTGKTHKDQAQLWKQWTTYCSWIGINDPFLDNFTCHALIKLLGAFAIAMQEAHFQHHLMSDWLKAQSQVPSHMYVGPSASTADPIYPWMTTARLDSFYNKN
jgi:hypothetical protein